MKKIYGRSVADLLTSLQDGHAPTDIWKVAIELCWYALELEKQTCPTCELIATGGMFVGAECTKYGRRYQL